MSRVLLLSACLAAGAGAQELRDIRLADIKAAIAAGPVAAPPARPAPAAKDGAGIIEAALDANRRLSFVIRSLENSTPWPKSPSFFGEAARIQLESERAAAAVLEASRRISEMRAALEEGTGVPAIELGLLAVLGEGDEAVESAIPDAHGMHDYNHYLGELKKADPRAKDLVAHMAMTAATANLRRAQLELRKEAAALASELGHRDPAEYLSELESRRAGPWKKAGEELDEIARTIGPDNREWAREVQSLRVFDSSPSL